MSDHLEQPSPLRIVETTASRGVIPQDDERYLRQIGYGDVVQELAALREELAQMKQERDSWRLAFEGLERQHKALTEQIPAERIDADPILIERVTTAAAIEEIGRQQIADLQQELAQAKLDLLEAQGIIELQDIQAKRAIARIAALEDTNRIAALALSEAQARLAELEGRP